MAILIKEKQNKGALTAIFIGSIVLIITALLSYNLFFSPAPVIETEKSEGYQRASLFANAKLDVDSVLHLPAWKLLNQETFVPQLIIEVQEAKINPFQQF